MKICVPPLKPIPMNVNTVLKYLAGIALSLLINTKY